MSVARQTDNLAARAGRPAGRRKWDSPARAHGYPCARTGMSWEVTQSHLRSAPTTVTVKIGKESVQLLDGGRELDHWLYSSLRKWEFNSRTGNLTMEARTHPMACTPPFPARVAGGWGWGWEPEIPLCMACASTPPPCLPLA